MEAATATAVAGFDQVLLFMVYLELQYLRGFLSQQQGKPTFTTHSNPLMRTLAIQPSPSSPHTQVVATTCLSPPQLRAGQSYTEWLLHNLSACPLTHQLSCCYKEIPSPPISKSWQCSLSNTIMSCSAFQSWPYPHTHTHTHTHTHSSSSTIQAGVHSHNNCSCG